MTRYLVGLVSVGIAGCAVMPDKVPAQPYRGEELAAMSCEQLVEVRTQTDKELAYETERQKKALDEYSAFALSNPSMQMLGINRAGEIAKLRGKKMAIEEQQVYKGCT